MRRFRAIIELLGVSRLSAVATAAVRDAQNGAEFIARAEEACGFPIQLLPGEREAELAAQGILLGFGHVDGVAGDLGGGSLELIDIAGSQLRRKATLPLGGLRLLDVSRSNMEEALTFTEAEFDRHDWIRADRGRTFYAVGGTWRALARVHMAERDYPLRVMQGYAISPREAIALCEDLRNGKKLKGLETVARARREVLPVGLSS